MFRSAPPSQPDRDFGVISDAPNRDLVQFIDLIDRVRAGEHKLHAALFWPHIPSSAILPWMLREVSRGRESPPLRTLFVNMGRPALRAVAGIEARTERLRARGLVRGGVKADEVPAFIGPDAHFYMFLGDTAYSGIAAVPLVSIVPHAVALNDGTFWRDFDEKTLKGFKRLYPPARLNSIRKHLDILSSAERSPSFAFLLPSHFPDSDRRDALRRMPGTIDLAIIDMTTHAVGGRDASALIRDLVDGAGAMPAVAARPCARSNGLSASVFIHSQLAERPSRVRQFGYEVGKSPFGLADTRVRVRRAAGPVASVKARRRNNRVAGMYCRDPALGAGKRAR